MSSLEIFPSFRRSDCDEREFVLMAFGIASTVHFDDMHFVLTVADPQGVEAAAAHLARYAAESRPTPPPPAPQRLFPLSFVLAGCIANTLALLLIALVTADAVWRLELFEIAAIDSRKVQTGEWWRAWTALTLHHDFAHLAANLGGGMWFGYLAGRQLGQGHAWLLTVVGGGMANLLESLLGPATHHSVGASTAVFTLLGLMATYIWRIRLELPQRWALRWGPLVGGVLLLGWMGTGGLSASDGPDVIAASTTDIVAHVAGFVVGTVLGAVAAVEMVRRRLLTLPQWIAGIAGIAILAIGWSLALKW